MKDDGEQRNVALLVIDVQQGLFERSTPILNGEQLLANINTLIHRARQAGAPVLYVQHANKSTLVKDSAAWQLHPTIVPLDSEEIVHKRHGNAFQNTGLAQELVKRDVSVLAVTGLVTHGCVKATSLGAIEKGYQVILVSDGHSNFHRNAATVIEEWNQKISEKGAKLMATQDVHFAGAGLGDISGSQLS